MQKKKETKLELFYVMIASKYFLTKDDFLNTIQVCSKFKELIDMFHYNPIPIPNQNFFKNLQTQNLYSPKDVVLKMENQAIAWYPVGYSSDKNPNIIYKQIFLTKEERRRLEKKQKQNKVNDENGIGKIHSFVVPPLVTIVDNLCFSQRTKLTSIELPTNLKQLGNYVFCGCTSLYYLTIPTTVTSIGKSCFTNCSSLVDLDIPDSVIKLEQQTFWGCNELERIQFPFSIKPLHISLGYLKKLTSINIISCKKYPYKVPVNTACCLNKCNISCTNISLSQCDLLKIFPNKSQPISLKIPTKISSINDDCFAGYSQLTSLTIHSNIKYIGNNSFKDCLLLNNISLTGSSTFKLKVSYWMSKAFQVNNVTCSNIQYTREDEERNECIQLVNDTEMVINFPTIVTSLSDNCFIGCDKLKQIHFPPNIKSIGDYCFINCDSLHDVFFTTSLTRIGSGCFCARRNRPTAHSLHPDLLQPLQYRFYKNVTQ